MQFNENIVNDEVLDDILKEATDGYGDLTAAALVHRVSINALQARVLALRRLGVAWIS